MFEQLNQEKIMYFKEGKQPLAYKEALKQLATHIGQADISLPALEKKILDALAEAAIALNANKKLTAENNKVLLAFYKWVQSIHNDNLAAPEGARFPNNIIYDLLILLRNQNNVSAQETLLRFFLDGANARKISNGKTPHLDFIATTLAADSASAVKKIGGELSDAAKQFLDKYESLANYSSAQKQLEAACTQLKEDTLYGFLSSKDVFNFKRKKNEETGANRYLFDEAKLDAAKALQSNFASLGEMQKAVDAMLAKIKEAYPQPLAAFENARQQSTLEAHLLAQWDASEWVSRIYVALCVATDVNSFRYLDDLKQFVKRPFVAEIITKSETGDFPAKARNATLAAMELTELFTQQQLAALADKKAPLSFMWKESSSNTDKFKSTNIRITNGKTLTIEQGGFVGDLKAARDMIENFCAQNTVTYKGLGYGYDELNINGKNHNITPYGIDLPMMLEFCGIENQNTPVLKHG